MAHDTHFYPQHAGARPPPLTRPHRTALACMTSLVATTCLQPAHAQTTSDATLPRVTVTAPAAGSTAAITGFGDRPIDSLPLQATVIDREQLDAAGARRLADVLKLDASTTDAYNAAGYWDFIAVRGYTIDQRFNYRREGLPISAETAIPLENKERVEILKGTSGIQAGTSAPGGLVNYVVKRPTAVPLRSVTLSTGERGSLGLAVDLSDRAGSQREFGWRLNATSEDRRPQIEDYGRLRRSLLAVAGDWQIDAGSLLQVEIEASKQTGASLPGYSLLGDALPAPRKPANLNNQPWSLPNVFEGLTGSLRYERTLGSGWRWTSQVGAQRLRTDDRLAYAFGCTDGDVYYADRYCPNGDFDLYDFRSDGERRRVDALETALQGQVQTAGLTHSLRVGLQASRQRTDVQRQAFNFVGTGNIDGTLVTPADPALTDEGTNRKERSTEFFANDAIDWGAGWTTWLGLRHTRLQRESVRTDGSRATSYDQSITTPWLAAAYEWRPRQTVYASWGRGAESAVVPGRVDRYGDAAGQALPVLESRQWEIGLKGRTAAPTAADGTGLQASWSAAWFDIDRPAITDTGTAYFIDGSARHRGIDASASVDAGPWTLAGSGMWLDAERRGAQNAALNGQRPVNVPRHTLRLQGRYRVAAVPHLELATDVSHEGPRNVLVLPDGSIELPSWTRTDVGLRWRQPTSAGTLTWRLGIDNVFDRRAWKESPTQFGHVYLYPLDARTLRLSLQATL